MTANCSSRLNDFAHSPAVVWYEVNRLPDHAPPHWPDETAHCPHPRELTTREAKQLAAELTIFPKPPRLVFTGGDPLGREDLFDLVAHASEAGLRTGLALADTPVDTLRADESLDRLKFAGLGRLAVTLDGARPRLHDRRRSDRGGFRRTLRVIEWAAAAGLAVEVNTTLSRQNLGEIDAVADLLAGLGIELWSIAFPVPDTDGTGPRLSERECEQAFETLWRQSLRRPYAIQTADAPHYRRFVLQQQHRRPSADAATCTNDAKGELFVSHTGEIFPGPSLPIHCGRFPFDSVVRVYQQSPLFQALRDADRLGGKCGACEFRHVCGGSRARAYAVTGDPLAREPDCAYVPPAWGAATGTGAAV
jgi:AdoMet-dependent heme synthase